MTSCSAAIPETKKFGVKVCRERKCPDLQKDPKYPNSPQHCAVTRGMPGAMHCCIKEMDAEHFIRQISGQLNSSPYDAPHPGPRNCPKECPYKILVDGEKFVFEKGKAKSSKVPAKIPTCAFTGRPLNEWGACPCNVLGNPLQEDQIKRLQTIVSARLRNIDPTVGLCNMGVCPDGKDRGAPMTEDDRCPMIRMPFGDINPGMGCPLWRIPARLLPAVPETITHTFKDKSGKVTGTTTRPAKKPVQKEQPDATDAKIAGSRQLTIMDFVISRKSKKSTRPPGAGTGGGPQPYIQQCCGTCGHHKGRKTFHETCPRLGELLFKGGTKSAKVLMEETSRENCEHWIDNTPNEKCNPEECPGGCENYGHPEKGCDKGSHVWFARSINNIRCSSPGWHWEIWKIDQNTGDEWLVDGNENEKKANAIRKHLATGDKANRYEVRKRPDACDPDISKSCTKEIMAGCIASTKHPRYAICTAGRQESSHEGNGTEKKHSASKKSKKKGVKTDDEN